MNDRGIFTRASSVIHSGMIIELVLRWSSSTLHGHLVIQFTDNGCFSDTQRATYLSMKVSVVTSWSVIPDETVCTDIRVVQSPAA